MRFATFFAVIAALLVMLAVSHGGFYLVLLWPAFSCALLSWAYFRSQPAVFGKRSDGTIPLRTATLLFPYLAANWTLWHVHRWIVRETARHELLPGVWIGRRLLAHELPAEFDQVIDLTCEFPEPDAIRSRPRYRCFPILDGGVAPVSTLLEMLREIDPQQGSVYIHCAGGKGRTGLVAAVLALVRGEAANADEAIEFARRRRGLIALSRGQRRIVEECALVWGDEDSRLRYALATHHTVSKEH